jgi:hypothetical protein
MPLTFARFHDGPFRLCATSPHDSLDLEQVLFQVHDWITQLMRRIDFLEASPMREQVHIAREELRGPDGMTITFDAITSFLGLTRQSVFNHLHRPIHIKPVGCPKCLPPEAFVGKNNIVCMGPDCQRVTRVRS